MNKGGLNGAVRSAPFNTLLPVTTPALRKTLKKNGVPPDSEARMVKASGLRCDSPAKKAQKKLEVPLVA